MMAVPHDVRKAQCAIFDSRPDYRMRAVYIEVKVQMVFRKNQEPY